MVAVRDPELGLLATLKRTVPLPVPDPLTKVTHESLEVALQAQPLPVVTPMTPELAATEKD